MWYDDDFDNDPLRFFLCPEQWGDAGDQICVREWDHGGVHIDSKGREWGWVPKEGF